MPAVIQLEVVFDQDFEPSPFAQKELAKDVREYLERERWGWGRARVAEVTPGSSQTDLRDWLYEARAAVEPEEGSNDAEHECLIAMMDQVQQTIREPEPAE